MTASGEPAVCMRWEISGSPEAESCDGLCECMVPREMVEIAESIDEVRGIGCVSSRFMTPAGGGDVVDRGEGGEELPRWTDSGNGDETFRSWLYEWAFGGEAAALLIDDPSVPPVVPFPYVFPIPERSSRGEAGWFGLGAKLKRGERGECCESPVILMAVGDFGLLESP